MKDKLQEWVSRHGGENVLSVLFEEKTFPGVRAAQRLYNGQRISTDSAALMAIVARPDPDDLSVQYDLLFHDDRHLFSVKSTYNETKNKDGRLMKQQNITLRVPLVVKYVPAPFLLPVFVVFMAVSLPFYGWFPLSMLIALGLVLPVEETIRAKVGLPDNKQPLPGYNREQLQQPPTIKQVDERSDARLFVDTLRGPFEGLDLKEEYEQHHGTESGTKLRPATTQEDVYVAFTNHADEYYQRTFNSDNELNVEDDKSVKSSHGDANKAGQSRLSRSIDRFEQALRELPVTDRAAGVLKELHPPANADGDKVPKTTVAEALCVLIGSTNRLANEVVGKLCSPEECEQIQNKLVALSMWDKTTVTPYNLLQKAKGSAEKRGHDRIDSTDLLCACLQTNTKAATILHEHGVTVESVENLLENLLE